jgi:hypothetical protein
MALANLPASSYIVYWMYCKTAFRFGDSTDSGDSWIEPSMPFLISLGRFALDLLVKFNICLYVIGFNFLIITYTTFDFQSLQLLLSHTRLLKLMIFLAVVGILWVTNYMQAATQFFNISSPGSFPLSLPCWKV